MFECALSVSGCAITQFRVNRAQVAKTVCCKTHTTGTRQFVCLGSVPFRHLRCCYLPVSDWLVLQCSIWTLSRRNYLYACHAVSEWTRSKCNKELHLSRQIHLDFFFVTIETNCIRRIISRFPAWARKNVLEFRACINEKQIYKKNRFPFWNEELVSIQWHRSQFADEKCIELHFARMSIQYHLNLCSLLAYGLCAAFFITFRTENPCRCLSIYPFHLFIYPFVIAY